MIDEQITAAPDILEISGKEFLASPFTDRDLDHLTAYVRYQINKLAREEAEFATDRIEANAIETAAFNQANGISWYEPAALTVLAGCEGTAYVAYRMVQKENKNVNKEWFMEQFGSSIRMTEEQIQNTINVRNMFTKLNSLKTEVSEPEKVQKSKKKKST